MNIEPRPVSISAASGRSLRAHAVGLTFLLAGCAAVGPEYRKPEVELPQRFAESGEPSGSPTIDPSDRPPAVTADTEWWRRFGDPVLTRLVRLAVEENLELAAARARIARTRALRRIAGAVHLPSSNAGAGYRRQRVSENGPVDLGTLSDAGLAKIESDLHQVGFDASWELDVFGGVRRGEEAARAEFEHAVESYRGVALTLIAEVVRNYVELRGAQARLAIAEQNAALQRRTSGLVASKVELGLAPRLDAVRAKTLLRETEAWIPLFVARSRAAMHRLSVLIGAVPGGLTEQLGRTAPVPVDDAPLPVGLPGDLLLRRPDVRAAERQLHASTARVGVATAELYPRFFVLGSAGVEATSLSDLGNGSSLVGSIGPSISWPIFRGGAVHARIGGAEARVREDYARFRQQVLIAVEEVERALVVHGQRKSEHARLSEAVESARESARLARSSYETGLGRFLDVLAAEQTLRTVEDRLAMSEIAVSLQVVAIYKALGGGWRVADPAISKSG